jgi:quercetin 2,3-dioxygenase
MFTIIRRSQKRGNAHIQIMYPGEALPLGDTGLGTIGRIDQADIPGGTTIKMHPHVNDDILSYFRRGQVRHTDSAQFTELIGRQRLMLMQAGKVFFHEEKILEPLEGLQIFIRPSEKDGEPVVSFYDLPQPDSLNEWRLLASPTAATPLRFTSQTWIYDANLETGRALGLPPVPGPRLTVLLYVFQGTLAVNNEVLQKGECVVMQADEPLTVATSGGAELVLFFTDTHSIYYDGGAFSGNQYKEN